MRVMISQPTKGKTNQEIRAEREEIVKCLEDQGHEVVDTVLDYPGKSPLYYLAKSLEVLADVDGLVILPGWEDARGCRIELTAAMDYGKFVLKA